MATPQAFSYRDTTSIGTQAAQPASGAVYLSNRFMNYPFFRLTFRFDAARVTVTDAAGSGSSGSLKIFTFDEGVVALIGSRHDVAGVAEGTALTTAAGDAAYLIAFGSAAANAGDGALTGTEVDWGAATATLTNSGGVATAATVITGPATGLDGTGTAKDVYLNWSGSAATIDATSTIDISGTFSIVGVLLGDD